MPGCGDPWAAARGRGTAPGPRGPGLRGTARGPRTASRRGASWSNVSRKGAVCGSHVAQNALFRHVAAREAWGATPPPACGALWRVAQLGKRARATPRQAAGGLRRGPQASAWGLASRKSAVWAEGLAEGAPRVRPGHHQAASCGLRRCREPRVRSPARVPLSKGSMGIPSSCLAARQQGIGCSEC